MLYTVQKVSKIRSSLLFTVFKTYIGYQYYILCNMFTYFPHVHRGGHNPFFNLFFFKSTPIPTTPAIMIPATTLNYYAQGVVVRSIDQTHRGVYPSCRNPYTVCIICGTINNDNTPGQDEGVLVGWGESPRRYLSPWSDLEGRGWRFNAPDKLTIRINSGNPEGVFLSSDCFFRVPRLLDDSHCRFKAIFFNLFYY